MRPVEPSTHNKNLVVFLVVALVAAAILSLVNIYQYNYWTQELSKAENYNNRLVALTEDNVFLLLDKIADISENKHLKTGVAFFGLLKSVFEEAKATRKHISWVEEQKRIICRNKSNMILAHQNEYPKIIDSYKALCLQYERYSSLVDRVEQLNNIIAKLVELDNAIALDP